MPQISDRRPGLRQRLSQILTFLKVPDILACDTEIEVLNFTLDSRGVQPGDVFIAVPGTHSDGRGYIQQAFASGAVAVLAEANTMAPDMLSAIHGDQRCIGVPDLMQKLSSLALYFWQNPTQGWPILAVTGTNGKTSVAYGATQLYQRLGVDAAFVGTLGYGRPDQLSPFGLTTPDALDMARISRGLCDAGVRGLALEASAHALSQYRIAALPVETAIFTQLTQDHFDYYTGFEDYFAAKARLFEFPSLKTRVINAGCLYGRRLLEQYADQPGTWCYGLAADQVHLPGVSFVQARHIRSIASDDHVGIGMRIILDSSMGSGEFQTPLLGDFNVYNLLALIAAFLGQGYALGDILEALSFVKPPPGRMDYFIEPHKQIRVVVDYAHTPDALEVVLKAIRFISSAGGHATAGGDIVCVFGCGGDRDPSKRSHMGRIAEAYADEVILTQDNSRTEDPQQIVAMICSGMRFPERARVVLDRAQAIAVAIARAKPGDTILVAGKGHEHYQWVGQARLDYSDRNCVLGLGFQAV
jgi:UDP-N-acetylmuramoyl-L-alanyl-D-glutamate--2,6-diaminopimelate ligase